MTRTELRRILSDQLNESPTKEHIAFLTKQKNKYKEADSRCTAYKVLTYLLYKNSEKYNEKGKDKKTISYEYKMRRLIKALKRIMDIDIDTALRIMNGELPFSRESVDAILRSYEDGSSTFMEVYEYILRKHYPKRDIRIPQPAKNIKQQPRYDPEAPAKVLIYTMYNWRTMLKTKSQEIKWDGLTKETKKELVEAIDSLIEELQNAKEERKKEK